MENKSQNNQTNCLAGVVMIAKEDGAVDIAVHASINDFDSNPKAIKWFMDRIWGDLPVNAGEVKNILPTVALFMLSIIAEQAAEQGCMMTGADESGTNELKKVAKFVIDNCGDSQFQATNKKGP